MSIVLFQSVIFFLIKDKTKIIKENFFFLTENMEITFYITEKNNFYRII